MSNFSTNLATLLKNRKIRQRTLAKEVGISQAAISYYLKGGRIPKSNHLIAIAQFFNVDCVQLIQGTIKDKEV